MTLITVDVHNRDVVQRLIEQKVQEASAFAWQSQMRYKWKNEVKDCEIRVADAQFKYSYEYVGNTGRLVITPLTDRCYITLTQVDNLFSSHFSLVSLLLLLLLEDGFFGNVFKFLQTIALVCCWITRYLISPCCFSQGSSSDYGWCPCWPCWYWKN